VPANSLALLLYGTSFLLASSGLIKIRSGSRTGLGISPLALIELVAAVVTAGLAISGGGAPPVVWSIPAALLLVVASSASHVRRLSAHRREREARLGASLATFVGHPGRGRSASEPRD
jgi:hypothetical protein